MEKLESIYSNLSPPTRNRMLAGLGALAAAGALGTQAWKMWKQRSERPSIRLDFAPELSVPNYMDPTKNMDLNLHGHMLQTIFQERQQIQSLKLIYQNRLLLFDPKFRSLPDNGNLPEMMRRLTSWFVLIMQSQTEDFFATYPMLRLAGLRIVNAALRFWSDKEKDAPQRDLLMQTGRWLEAMKPAKPETQQLATPSNFLNITKKDAFAPAP